MLNTPSAVGTVQGVPPGGHSPDERPPRYWDVVGGPAVPRPMVRMGGFKHLLVPSLAAACLADYPWRIDNAPWIEDRRLLCAMLRDLGAAVEDHGGSGVTVDASRMRGTHIPAHQSAGVHGGVYLLPVLLAARGEVSSGLHGGCAIGGGAGGARPLSHVASVLERFGAECQVSAEGFRATAPHGGLRGAVIDLADYAETEPRTGKPTGPYYSGATKTALLSAVTARGTSVLRHPYPKPDALELAHLLAQAGARIGVSAEQITVEGLGGPLGGAHLTLPSDLMEVVTFIAWAVHLRRDVDLLLDRPELVRAGLAPELRCLREMGVPLVWEDSLLEVRPTERVKSARVLAASHELYSDAGPLFALMLLGADGPSRLTDGVWGSRFDYAAGLRRMGARLDATGNELRIRPGTPRPSAEPLMAGDLRSAATLLLAALGTGVPHRLYGVAHLARGYEYLPEKLAALGARISTPDGTGEAA